MTSQTDAVGGKYDQFAQAGTTEALGGNIHAGYWDSGAEHVPMAAATDRLTDLVAERLALRPGDRVLDVGCGNGFPAMRIAETHDVHVTGITVSQQEVDRATELAAGSERVAFRLADAASLPDDLGTFDAVFAIESLLHLSDQAAALARLRRFVRPGGRLVVADLCQREPFTGAGEAVLAGMVRTLEIAGINSEQEHRAGLEKAGWDLVELLDIGENVRPSYAQAAEAFRRIADTAPPFAAADIITAAELMAAFGENPSSGYVLITAQRP
ncbi:methyltransferase type 11 [Lentzea pudingi]|uniref:Methyltransferase type 11 n=1 Tax=Lentzea pudingi TaxID=1789439 RepID=A0ABQ2H8U9_9PSEU|nr:class I SAM-dependent methyltransferase [Lentzea pudingi]GGM69499.1 methyltransferase type 11 [Lentzea pudingi]